MLNGFAICLLLTTLATTGVFTPTPPKQKSLQKDVIVKEGHMSVMVEYDADGGSNTKVLISPEDLHLGVAENALEKLTETVSSILPNGKEEATLDRDEKIKIERNTPRELVCDAFGKCNHKLVSAFGKTKEMLYKIEQGAKETVENVKDSVSDKAHETQDKVEEVSVKAKDKAHGAKEDVIEKVQELKQGATQILKQGAKDVVDSAKKVKQDIEQNGSVIKEATKRKGKEVEEKLKESKKEMKDILRRGKGVIYDAFRYSFPQESLDSSFRTMQLLGFSVAFGMAIWVTFISSYVLAGVLPRQQFAMVQSKIYPLYFKAMSYSIGIALLAHLLNKRSRLYSNAAEVLQGFGLLASLSMALVNLWYLEPHANKVMFERMKLEKEEARGLGVSASAEPGSKVVASHTVTQATPILPGVATTTAVLPISTTQKTVDASASAAAMAELVRLSELLKKLNSLSSFLNVLTLMFLTCHLVHLGQGGLQSSLCAC